LTSIDSIALVVEKDSTTRSSCLYGPFRAGFVPQFLEQLGYAF